MRRREGGGGLDLCYQCRRTYLFQTMKSAILNNLQLKYQRFSISGCKDIWFRKRMYRFNNIQRNGNIIIEETVLWLEIHTEVLIIGLSPGLSLKCNLID